MGRSNQLYGRYVRIMQSVDDPNEIYIVIKKDSPMEKKYIRKFDNMYSGKDVIISFSHLIRSPKPLPEAEGPDKEEGYTTEDSPFWSVQG